VSQIRIAGEPNYETRYAFIEFTTPEEVWYALVLLMYMHLVGWAYPTRDLCLLQASTALLLDGMMVFERPIKVNMARGGSGPGIVRSNDPDRVQRTIHVGGLPFDELQEETLAEYFGHVGEVCPACGCPHLL
jgi:RNA recognition motif-containing protein